MEWRVGRRQRMAWMNSNYKRVTVKNCRIMRLLSLTWNKFNSISILRFVKNA